MAGPASIGAAVLFGSLIGAIGGPFAAIVGTVAGLVIGDWLDRLVDSRTVQ